MTKHEIINAYLSTAEKGVHLHTLDYPGCYSRGQTLAASLLNLQGELRRYLNDLIRHGETHVIPGHFEIRIAEGQEKASGPFDPGDTAALFAAEETPLSDEAIHRGFQLAAYNRTDLLTLAGNLPDALLDWQPPEPGAFTIRRILRHIGKGDQWYASRIIQPDDYPSEWENDDQMPVYEYLEMSRRTVEQIFRQLSAEQKSGQVRYPAHSTSNPNEPWTAAKALRRLLEHEREHTAHIREVLDARKSRLMEKLAASREQIRQVVEQVPDTERGTRLVTGSWTLKEVIAHLADWEKIGLKYAAQALAGETTTAMPEFAENDIDRINAKFQDARLQQTWVQVFEDYLDTRKKMMELVENASSDDLTRKFEPPWGGETTLSSFFADWAWHDDEHLHMIREETGLSGQ